jgi:ribosomal protein S28E/S33
VFIFIELIVEVKSQNMDKSKIIAVVGGTGAQGRSLVNAILNDKSGGFKARVITRNANSDKA